jgi:hypothetical protein
VHGARHILAHQILHVPESRIRVVARDVGGGFGMKGNVYPEEAVVLWAACRVGRPVKWIPSRSEALLGDYEGATRMSAPSWRSTPTASFWHCAGSDRTMSAPISRAPARSRSSFR